MNGTQLSRTVIVISAVVAGAAATQAGPVASDGYRFVGGEIGYVAEARSAGATSAKTREQVRRELDQFKRSPITADGYRYVGGEIGFIKEDPASTALGSGTGRGLSRAEVEQDLLKFQRNPLSADGAWRYMGGEQGWVPANTAH